MILFFWNLFMKGRRIIQRTQDRWQTAALSQQLGACGRDCRFYFPVEVTGVENAKIGENVHINRGAFIRAEGGLTIGDNVHIGRNLVVYTINHNYKGEAIPYDHGLIKKPVTIGRNVWLGINVTVVPGVTIGEGAIIGAGTLVAQDIPPFAMVGSQPARILRYRDQNHYERLERKGHYGGVNGRLYKSEKL